MKSALVSLITAFSMGSWAQSTCLGSKEATLKVVNDIRDINECANADSLQDCQESLKISSVLAEVGGNAAVLAAVRLRVQDLCRKGVALSPQDLKWLLFTGHQALALPGKACPIDAQLLNNAINSYMDDMEKVARTNLKQSKEALDAMKSEHIQRAIHVQSLEVNLEKAKRDMAAHPERWFLEHQIKNPEQKARLVREKTQDLDRYLRELKQTADPKKIDELRAKSLDAFKGFKADPYVKNHLLSNKDSELGRLVAKADKANPLERARAYENLARRYPSMNLVAGEMRRMVDLEVATSELIRNNTSARGLPVRSMDDVIGKLHKVQIPNVIAKDVATDTAKSFINFRRTAMAQLGSRYGAALRQTGKKVFSISARSLALMLRASTSFAAEGMLYTSPGDACSDYPHEWVTKQTIDGKCEALPVLGYKTQELFLTQSDDEILKALTEPRFCQAMKEFHQNYTVQSWTGTCTGQGFRLSPKNAQRPKSYNFETGDQGQITRVRMLESNPLKPHESNFDFHFAEDGSLKEARKLVPSLGYTSQYLDFSMPTFYLSTSGKDFVEKKSRAWNPARESLGEFHEHKHLILQAQSCCQSSESSQTATCRALGMAPSQPQGTPTDSQSGRAQQ